MWDEFAGDRIADLDQAVAVTEQRQSSVGGQVRRPNRARATAQDARPALSGGRPSMSAYVAGGSSIGYGTVKVNTCPGTLEP
jgi:hypothetical protein